MAGKRKCRSTIPGLSIAVLCGCAVHVSAQRGQVKVIKRFERRIEQTAQSLDSIKAELRKGRQRLGELSKQEDTYLQRLEQLEQNIATSRRYVSGLDRRIDSVSAHIDSLGVSLEETREQLRKRQEKMRLRLRNIYKAGRSGPLEALLTSGDMTDMLHRLRYFQALNRYDRMLLTQIDSARSRISTDKKTLEQQRTRLVSLREEKSKEQSELLAERSSRESIIGNIRSEKSAYEAMVRELEAAQEELNTLIEQLEKRRVKAKTEYEQGLSVKFEERKGKLAWPVSGEIVRGFGKIVHPVYKTVTVNNGIDISAARGETVHCVAPGRVVYIGRMRGLGKFIVVDHFGGYLTIYGHLDAVRVGLEQSVNFGAVLGTVGESGSLSGAQLHFEVRKSTSSLDPTVWLEKQD